MIFYIFVVHVQLKQIKSVLLASSNHTLCKISILIQQPDNRLMYISLYIEVVFMKFINNPEGIEKGACMVYRIYLLEVKNDNRKL